MSKVPVKQVLLFWKKLYKGNFRPHNVPLWNNGVVPRGAHQCFGKHGWKTRPVNEEGLSSAARSLVLSRKACVLGRTPDGCCDQHNKEVFGSDAEPRRHQPKIKGTRVGAKRVPGKWSQMLSVLPLVAKLNGG